MAHVGTLCAVGNMLEGRDDGTLDGAGGNMPTGGAADDAVDSLSRNAVDPGKQDSTGHRRRERQSGAIGVDSTRCVSCHLRLTLEKMPVVVVKK